VGGDRLWHGAHLLSAGDEVTCAYDLRHQTLHAWKSCAAAGSDWRGICGEDGRHRMLAGNIKSRAKASGNICGRAPEMDEAIPHIRSKWAGQSTHPVLILGESGTGKELVAKSIHMAGTFPQQALSFRRNCGSLVRR